MQGDYFWERPEPRVEPAQVSGWTIPAIVRARAAREPDRAVYGVPTGNGFRRVSWGEFGAGVAEVAAGLSTLGLEAGARTTVMGDPSLEWVYCDFGSLACRAVTAGIYHTSSWQEVSHVFADATPQVFFGQSRGHLEAALTAAAAQSSPRVFVLMEGEPGGLQPPDPQSRVLSLAGLRQLGRDRLAADPHLVDRLIDAASPTELARIIYTSGTTGLPKGVMYTHQAWLLVGEQWVLRFPPIRLREHASVAFMSTAHVASAVATEIAPLLSRLLPHFPPAKADLLDVFRAVRPEVLGMTPRFFQKIAVQLAVQQGSGSKWSRALHRFAMNAGRRVVRDRWEGEETALWWIAVLALARRTIFRRLLGTVGLDRVKRAQTGSAVMPIDVATLWAVWGVDVREAYGLSEAACAVTYQQQQYPRPGTIGRLLQPQPGTELTLADDGEILFKSEMLFSGYWNHPEATAKALRDGWFYSGDLAERTADGELRLIGRKNEAISTAGGKTVNPAEIEKELKRSPYISEAIVIGAGEKYLTALIEIERETLAAWAFERGINADSYPALAAAPEVARLIEGEVTRANEGLGRALQIKKFRVVPRSLDSVHDALTAAKKVRRRVVQGEFKELIESMYDRSEDRILTEHLAK